MNMLNINNEKIETILCTSELCDELTIIDDIPMHLSEAYVFISELNIFLRSGLDTEENEYYTLIYSSYDSSSPIYYLPYDFSVTINNYLNTLALAS